LYGQEITGTIRGIVTDPARAVVRSARITATNQSTGAHREVRSGADGSFVVPLLPVGSYEFAAEAPGFRRYVRRGVQVSVAQQLELDITLTLGEVNETVLVDGSAEEVNIARGSVGQVMETTAIQQLPLNGRNYLQLATLQAGVAPRGPAVTESTPVLPGQQSFSVNGLRPQSNNFLLDGADNNDGVLGSAAAVPSPDALEEFRILTNAYSAEYGRGGGAVVNVLTRSGTNQLHGSAYDYLRNNTFDARNYFSPTVPTLIRNQFGGSLGGPLRKDRTFLFGIYEGLRQKQGTVASATVLSARERQGDFSQTATKPRDPSTNAPFADNLIPASRINPIARNILARIPLPNAGPNTLISTADNVTNSNQLLLRGDHIVSSKNTLSARYFRQTGDIAKPFTFPPPVNIPGLPFEDQFGFHNVVLSDTHTFRSNLLNESRLNVGRTRTFNNHPAYRVDPASLGFTYPAANIPMILGSGLTAFGTSTSSDGLRRDTTFQFQNHVTWVKGRHTVKFGLDIYHNRFSLREDSGVNGSFNFTGGVSGSASADLLLGLASRFSQASAGTTAYFRSNLIQPYIQDDFRVSRRLTLNFGLRYELNLPVSEAQNRLLAFRPGQKSQMVPAAPSGLLFQGDPGVDQIIRTDTNNWAPRLGFAWDVFGDAKTSFRGGYGLFYDAVLGVIYTNTAVSLPFTVSASPPTVQSFANPWGTQNPFLQANSGLFFPIFSQLTVIDRNYSTPCSHQWNLSLERALPRSVVLTAGYVGTRGLHLPGTQVLNTGVFAPGANVRNIDARRPFGPSFGQILNFMSELNSSYHSLQLSGAKRFSNGLTFLTAYTYGKAIDQGSFPTGRLAVRVGTLVQDQNNYAAERGLANFDQRHRFTTSYVWDLPWLRGRKDILGFVAGGWQFSGILTMASGQPFIVQDGSDPNVDGVASDRPNVVRNPNLPASQRTLARWWDTGAFTRIPSGTNAFGNAGRNIVIGPNLRNFDASLAKSFRLRETANLQFRWEVFNVPNRPNFANPSGGSPTNDVSSPLFGQIQSTQANNERVMQLGLRLTF
jgi:hypothetical protein